MWCRFDFVIYNRHVGGCFSVWRRFFDLKSSPCWELFLCLVLILWLEIVMGDVGGCFCVWRWFCDLKLAYWRICLCASVYVDVESHNDHHNPCDSSNVQLNNFKTPSTTLISTAPTPQQPQQPLQKPQQPAQKIYVLQGRILSTHSHFV